MPTTEQEINLLKSQRQVLTANNSSTEYIELSFYDVPGNPHYIVSSAIKDATTGWPAGISCGVFKDVGDQVIETIHGDCKTVIEQKATIDYDAKKAASMRFNKLCGWWIHTPIGEGFKQYPSDKLHKMNG